MTDNRRVDQMMEEGLLDEVRSVLSYRHLNSLNTVGYKELFKYLDGEWELPFAIEKIKQNSRIYSRKQMTWFKRDEEIRWFHPEQETEILEYLRLQNLTHYPVWIPSDKLPDRHYCPTGTEASFSFRQSGKI